MSARDAALKDAELRQRAARVERREARRGAGVAEGADNSSDLERDPPAPEEPLPSVLCCGCRCCREPILAMNRSAKKTLRAASEAFHDLSHRDPCTEQCCAYTCSGLAAAWFSLWLWTNHLGPLLRPGVA